MHVRQVGEPPGESRRRVAYLVSRFPHVTETFIVREMERVQAQGLAVHVRSLFPRSDSTDFAAAGPWLHDLRRPTAGEAALAVLWWTSRRPGASLRALLAVLAGHSRSPRMLLRALVTVSLAAAHARELGASGVRHVHAHYATYPALAAWLCRRLTGASYSFTAHAHDLYVDQSMLTTKVREASFVSTISQYNRQFLQPYAAGSGTRVEVVHCGVRVRDVDYRPRSPAREGWVNALTVASLQEYKGHSYLLQALRDPRLVRVRLELVGAGPLRESLEDEAAALGVADRVRFHGALPEETVSEHLERADLFVLPSVVARDGQMEGIPVALMEAMAHGLPVVATRLSGIPELVRDGVDGLLAEPADTTSLADAIAATLDDPATTRERLRSARRHVEVEYDLDHSGRLMARLLHDALDGPRARP